MTFVAPPGMMPSDVSVPASEFRASLMVPSPENTTTRSNPPATASRASSVAWPRAFVSWTSSLKSDCNARSMTSSAGLRWARSATSGSALRSVTFAGIAERGIASALVSTTARSSAFSSSRTLPGQS